MPEEGTSRSQERDDRGTPTAETAEDRQEAIFKRAVRRAQHRDLIDRLRRSEDEHRD